VFHIKKNSCLFFFLLLLALNGKAQLVINEVSQGFAGNQEYVELLVVGTPTCTTIPTYDLRGYYIDDNNGTYAAGAGTGIAQGCVRFANDPFWSAIPIGTLILIYNDADLNPDVPAQDLSMTDGNCTLVIPVSNCTFLEKHTTQPNTITSTYPTTGLTACGGWTQLGMANTGDSFHTVDPSGNPIFSVSWGNNSTATVIYFAGAQGGMVCSMTNSTNNNPSTQSNWVSQAVAGNQTPGAPNNAANGAWINSMNNSCGVLLPLAVTSTVTNAGCTCNGSATVTASGAIGPYTYSWSPSGGSSASASGLCAGNYSVTVTSSNGCTQTIPFIISSISPITTSITSTGVNCNGGSSGSATVTASNGTGAYTYSWSPSGGNGSSASGLNAGNYTVAITDGVGCTATASVSITQPPALTVTPTQTNVACNGGTNGVGAVSVSGGTGTYNYTWTPSGGNSSTASALAAGTYTADITDANGCGVAATFSITQPPALTLTLSSVPSTCGANNGSALSAVNGGTGAYTYTWAPSGGNAAGSSGLAAGNYSLAVSDANGCLLVDTISVVNTGGASVSISSSSVTCNGSSNGTATANASGGAGSYTYSWTPSGGSSATASGLAAGNYTITVTDGAGCISTATTTINQPAPITATLMPGDVSCFGGNDGSIATTVNGGTGAYSYSWSPAGGTSASPGSLSAGVYSVDITDGNGCIASFSTTINQPSQLSIITGSTQVSCNGGNNGSALSIGSGGTGPYTYSWTPGGMTTPAANGVPAGTYSVQVTDSKGCVQNASVIVSEPAAISGSVAVAPASCGLNNGTATVTASGGTGAYSYSWSPSGGTNNSASGLAPGNYTVTITDANNCSTTASAVIGNTGAVTLSVTTSSVTCFGGNNGAANVTATGGTGSYTYTWSPSGGNSSLAGALVAGIYTINVQDGSGCVQTATASVNQPLQLTVTLNGATLCMGQTFILNPVTAGGSTPYTFSWNGGSSSGSTLSVSPAATTTYSLVITDANNCSQTTNAAVTVLPALQVNTSGTSICTGNSAALAASATGGNGNYTYNWMPGNLSGSSVSVSPPNTTVYTVTVSDGCTVSNASDTGLVSVVQSSQITLPPATSGCAPQCATFAASSNTNIVSWQWNFGDNTNSTSPTPTHCYPQSGSYNVSLTYATTQGCIYTVSQNGLVTVYPQPQAAFSASTYETNIYDMHIYFYDQSVGANNVQWSFGDGSVSGTQHPDHNYASVGTYAVTQVVSNQYGCIDSVTHEIKINEDFTFYAPNAFSPDYDGMNDLFLPKGTGWDLTTFNLWIYDRWGNKVFQSLDASEGWKGNYKGEEIMQEDVYVWMVRLHDIFGREHEYKGTVSLIK